jgi:4-hydroxy-L-threonine phosphate dehydrogenase PdxA
MPLTLLARRGNVPRGLPLVRTVPERGTAFDIAGQGKTGARSMAAVTGLAAHMTQNRSANEPSHLS